MAKRRESSYALGYTPEEHARLIRQAALLAPCTERMFRAAGIGPGDRVLDLGSGIGDVSILLSRIVGPSGSVVGIERDAGSVARAEARIAEAGISNVSFVRSEASDARISGMFDAIAGRFILMYLPEPARILRDLVEHLRPHGAVAFMEPSWSPARGLLARSPIYSACITTIVDALKASGANPEMGLALHATFLDAGLPAPTMNVDMMLGADDEFADAINNILQSLAPQGRLNGVSFDALGDIATLGDRLRSEIQETRNPIPWLASHVGAWCRKPDLK